MRRSRRRDGGRAPDPRPLEPAFVEADRIAKGVEAERQAVARAKATSAEAETKRRLHLVQRAWDVAEMELYPKPSQRNLAMRMLCWTLFEWICNAGDGGLQVSYAVMQERKRIGKNGAIKAIGLLRKARLIHVDAVRRRATYSGLELDRAPNRYRIDWDGVADRLAASETERSDGSDGGEASGPASPDIQVETLSRFDTTLSRSDTRLSAPGGTTCTSHARTTCTSHMGYAPIRVQEDKPPPPTPVASAIEGPAASAAVAGAEAEEIVERRSEGSPVDWPAAERLLRETGLSGPVTERELRRARRRGYLPAEIARLVAAWREHRARFRDAGAIVWRLKAEPGTDPFDGWPIAESLRREPSGSRSTSRIDTDAFDVLVNRLVAEKRFKDRKLTPNAATELALAELREKMPHLFPRKDEP